MIIEYDLRFKINASAWALTLILLIQYSVDYPKVKHLNHQLSEPQLVKNKIYHVLTNYWLLFWNITKPMKALQEFLIECQL